MNNLPQKLLLGGSPVAMIGAVLPGDRMADVAICGVSRLPHARMKMSLSAMNPHVDGQR